MHVYGIEVIKSSLFLYQSHDYSTSAKCGLVAFSNTLAKEGEKYNVFCNTIVPLAWTRMSTDVMPPREGERGGGEGGRREGGGGRGGGGRGGGGRGGGRGGEGGGGDEGRKSMIAYFSHYRICLMGCQATGAWLS